MELVLAALITAVVGPVTILWLRWELGRRVGNGDRTTNDMLADLLAGQAGQDRRLASLEQRMGAVEERLPPPTITRPRWGR